MGHAALTFLVVCDDGLSDGLTDGVDLSSVTTSLHADADIDISETRESQKKDGLQNLEERRKMIQEGEWLDHDDGHTCIHSTHTHTHARSGASATAIAAQVQGRQVADRGGHRVSDVRKRSG